MFSTPSTHTPRQSSAHAANRCSPSSPERDEDLPRSFRGVKRSRQDEKTYNVSRTKSATSSLNSVLREESFTATEDGFTSKDHESVSMEEERVQLSPRLVVMKVVESNLIQV